MEEMPVSGQHKHHASLRDAQLKQPGAPSTQRTQDDQFQGSSRDTNGLHLLYASGHQAMNPPRLVSADGRRITHSLMSEESQLLAQRPRTAHQSLPPSYRSYRSSHAPIDLVTREISDHQEYSHSTSPTDESPKRKRKRRSSSSAQGVSGKQSARWNDMFDRLVEFKRLHGHCLVPNRYAPDPSLGAWVSTQRRHYKILMSEEPTEPTPMTRERIARLSAIGFAWATADPRHVPWETRFNQLLDYKRKHGDCVVPIGFEENPSLSNWVSAQRQEYKNYREGKKSRITPEKIQLLDDIGFVWVAQRGAKLGGSRKKRSKTKEVEEQSSHLGSGVREQQMHSAAVTSHVASRRLPLLEERQPPHSTHGRFPLLDRPIPPIRPFLGANHRANQLQQGALKMGPASAVRMMTGDRVNRQNRPLAAPPPRQTGFSDFLRPPPHGMAHPPSFTAKPTYSHVQCSVVDNTDDEDDDHDDFLTTRATGSFHSTIPYNRAIVAKHVAESLRPSDEFCADFDPTLVEAGVQKIQGILDRLNTQHPSPFPVPDGHTHHEPTRPSLRRDPPVSTTARNVRSDEKDRVAQSSAFGASLRVGENFREPSKFGVSLRVGEFTKKRDLSQSCKRVVVPQLDYDPGLRDACGGGPGISMSRAIGDDALGSAILTSNQDCEETTLQSRSATSNRDNSAAIESPNECIADSSQSTETDQSTDGGVFSDAEE